MGDKLPCLLAVIAIMAAGGAVSALWTRDTRWSFLFGFNTLLPAALVITAFADGSGWRRVMVMSFVAIYLARMNWTLVFWFAQTGASRLKTQMSVPQLVLLPVVLTFVFGGLYTLPFHWTAARSTPFDLWDGAALAVYGVGTVVHFTADWQKWKFRQNPDNRNQLLRRGLWGWSRHPNYVGDFLIYVAFWLSSASVWGLAAPLVNLAQYAADAIPKNEAMARRRHGADWKDYAAAVPVFLPRRWRRHGP